MKTVHPQSVPIILGVILGMITLGTLRTAAGDEKTGVLAQPSRDIRTNAPASARPRPELGVGNAKRMAARPDSVPVPAPVASVLGDGPKVSAAPPRISLPNVSSNTLNWVTGRANGETNKHPSKIAGDDDLWNQPANETTPRPALMHFSWFLDPKGTLNEDRPWRSPPPPMFSGFPSSRDWTGRDGTWDLPGVRLFGWRW